MSQSPDSTSGGNNNCLGCGCLSSLTLLIVPSVIIWTLALPSDSFLYVFLGLSVLVGLITLVAADKTSTGTYSPGRQDGDGGGHSVSASLHDLREQEEREREKQQQRQQEARLRETEHEQRKRALRAMPYKEYLQTPHWKRKRQEKLRIASHRCQVCNSGSTTLDVHHRTYERRGDELDEDLIVLCRTCHDIFHKHGRFGR